MIYDSNRGDVSEVLLFNYRIPGKVFQNSTRFRLKIETQNNNVNACKFYVKQGAKLTNINKFAYKDYPKEIQLIWNISIES